MADDSIIIRFGLDDSTFQNAISRINRSLRLTQSEFSLASSRLGIFGSSSESLRLRINNLNRQVEIQRDMVDTLNRRYQESVRATGENSRATEELRIRLNNATSELNNMQRELNVTSSRWTQVSEAMERARDKLKAVGDKMSSIGRNLSTYVTLPIIAVGTAAIKMAMSAVESENLFEVAMGKMAGEARKWSVETSKALGLNEYNVRKNVATFNSMLTSMGLTTDESLNMSEGMTQLAYDMASFYNINTEDAFLKLRAGLTGETEPLKALGVLVNETTTKTYAYTHGIAKQGAELTEAQKVQARYGVILEATKNAQGDLSRTMDSPTNKLRIMKEQVQQIGIQIGQILIPVLEKLINIIKPLLDKFQSLSKGQQEMIVKIALVAAAIGPLLFILGNVISMIGTLATVISTISGAIASAGGITAALGTAFTALTGPIGIAIAVIVGIVAAVAGFIAICIALYKNNEEFRNNINTIWNQIKNTIGEVINNLKLMISAFIELSKKLWKEYGDDIVKVLSSAFNVLAVIVNNALNAVKNVIQIVTSLIKGDWHGVWEGIKSLTFDYLNGIKNVIGSVLKLIVSILKYEFEAMKNNILTIWENIKNSITSIWNSISWLISNSVSSIRNMISNGWYGIFDVTNYVWDRIRQAITSPISAAFNFLNDQIYRIKNIFASLNIQLPHIKLPHFSISGSFSISPPRVPYLNVSWYASGGIFNRPSVIGVGESGSEAVIPIDRLDDLIAKAIRKVKGENRQNVLNINIQSFVNNTDKNIEQLAYELEFYRQRISTGRGGL